MMKLAYRVFILTLVSIVLAFAVTAQTTTTDSSKRSAKDDRNTAPTVGTGGTMGGPTGLFTVYDGQTLRKGEYTFSAALSNYDRDPGNVDISEYPVSFQIGVTNNFELFFNTDALRYIKVNSPGNLSGFYLPNSRLQAGTSLVSPAAIVFAPSGPGAGPLEGRAVFRPAGSQPFVQFPFIGGSAGNFGLPFSGPTFGFGPATNATLGPPIAGGNGADNFPGIGSPVGGILPGIVFQTTGNLFPTVFTLAPSYLPDAPFINRRYGQSSFSTMTFGGKWRFTGINNPVGVGLVGYYRFYMDKASDFSGFNQLQRGASPGGNRGDIGLTLFADARVARWANISANLGYHYNGSVKGEFPGGDFTLLDRGDELLASAALDFPVNKYFQPIVELRGLKYVGGRTPNAFENNPIDGIGGFRVFPQRWLGFGVAYRYHFNQQDVESFDDNDSFTGSAFISCASPQAGAGCTPRTVTSTFSGVPAGFQTSNDPHGYIVQGFIGRRNTRQEEIVNQFANVTGLTVSDTTITLPCPPGKVPREGTVCNDASTVSVATTASDPENDVLTYNYTVSGGRIVGTGANVQWDLSGATAGTYTITAGVDDGCGLCGKTETRTITIAECICDDACACPTLTISGPAGITNPGDTMTFTANVSGGSQSDVITYNWTVSAGTIESGQGTPSITVRTDNSLAGGNVTATVTLGGVPTGCGCDTDAAETAPVAPLPQAVQVDEFGKLSNDEIRGRLDSFFAELSNNPNNQGYIINYGTDREIAARERLITNHINFRNFDRSRITLVRGGDTGEGAKTKLYRIPPGAENPAP